MTEFSGLHRQTVVVLHLCRGQGKTRSSLPHEVVTQFNIHEAKTQFSKLVAAVESGETVTICRNGKPVIACVPAKPLGPFPFGAWRSLLADRTSSLDHMVAPTDKDLLDDMGL